MSIPIDPATVHWLSGILHAVRDDLLSEVTDDDRNRAAVMVHTIETAFGDSSGELALLSSADMRRVRDYARDMAHQWEDSQSGKDWRRIHAALGGQS